MERKIGYVISFLIILAIVIGAILFFQPEKLNPQIPPNERLSDEQLLQYARSSFDKGEMWGKHLIIGYHNEVPVEVSFPCSDVCPDATIRIIRYNVTLKDCKSVDGKIKSIYVPRGIGIELAEFCFPKVIVENIIYTFVEK